MMQFTRYLEGLQKCLEAYKTLLQSLEDHDALSDLLVIGRAQRPEVIAVAGATAAVTTLHGQIQTDLPLAKREIAYGKLSPDDLKDINRLLRFVLLPVVGLNSLVEILQQMAAYRGWTEERINNQDEKEKIERNRLTQEWSSNMKLVHKPFEEIIDVMKEAIEHILLQLQFKSQPKSAKSAGDTDATPVDVEKDVESTAQATAPGDPGFASYLTKKSEEFYQGKHLTLIEWARKRGIALPDDFFSHPDAGTFAVPEELKDEAVHQQNQRQLFLLLYVGAPVFQSPALRFYTLRQHCLRVLIHRPGIIQK
jgi:Putative ER transporter, 6TM, N-terminal